MNTLVFHGKEGVAGSSPAEGLRRSACDPQVLSRRSAAEPARERGGGTKRRPPIRVRYVVRSLVATSPRETRVDGDRIDHIAPVQDDAEPSRAEGGNLAVVVVHVRELERHDHRRELHVPACRGGARTLAAPGAEGDGLRHPVRPKEEP